MMDGMEPGPSSPAQAPALAGERARGGGFVVAALRQWRRRAPWRGGGTLLASGGWRLGGRRSAPPAERLEPSSRSGRKSLERQDRSACCLTLPAPAAGSVFRTTPFETSATLARDGAEPCRPKPLRTARPR